MVPNEVCKNATDAQVTRIYPPEEDQQAKGHLYVNTTVACGADGATIQSASGGRIKIKYESEHLC